MGIPDELFYVYIVVYLASMAFFVLFGAVRKWEPSRAVVVVAAVAEAVAMVLISVEQLAGFVIGGVAFAMLTLAFGMVVAQSGEEEGFLSLVLAIVMSAVVLLAITPLPPHAQPAILALMPVAYGILFANSSELDAAGRPLAKPSSPRKGVAVISLVAIAVGFILCSVLNGITAHFFSISSSMSLVTYCTSAVLCILAIVVMNLLKKAIKSFDMLGAVWPMFAMLLIAGLTCLSSGVATDSMIPLSIVFMGINFFYLGSWIISPIIISRYGLPMVPSFGTLSIFCIGLPWRYLGQFLAEQNTDLFSAGMFGSVTTGVILVFMVVFLGARSAFPESAKPEEGQGASPDSLSEVLAAEGEKYELTSRELEVARLLVAGYSASRIGAKLWVSENTVRFHIKNIYKKFGIHSKQDLLDMLKK